MADTMPRNDPVGKPETRNCGWRGCLWITMWGRAGAGLADQRTDPAEVAGLGAGPWPRGAGFGARAAGRGALAAGRWLLGAGCWALAAGPPGALLVGSLRMPGMQAFADLLRRVRA